MADQRSEGNWNSVEGSPRDHRPPEEDSSSNASSGRNGHIRDFNAGTNNEGPSTPPLLSSPSAVSSIGAFSNAISPLRRELTRSTLHDEPDNVSSSSSKLALAHRLSHLAQQLTSDDKVDELTLNNQVDEMERAMAQMSPRMANHSRSGSRFETRSHDGPGSSLLSSPSSSLFRPQFSDLSASLMPKGAEPESEKRQEQQKTTISRRQVDKIIAEATKLNDELTIVVANLKARQEESDVSVADPTPGHNQLTLVPAHTRPSHRTR